MKGFLQLPTEEQMRKQETKPFLNYFSLHLQWLHSPFTFTDFPLRTPQLSPTSARQLQPEPRIRKCQPKDKPLKLIISFCWAKAKEKCVQLGKKASHVEKGKPRSEVQLGRLMHGEIVLNSPSVYCLNFLHSLLRSKNRSDTIARKKKSKSFIYK